MQDQVRSENYVVGQGTDHRVPHLRNEPSMAGGSMMKLVETLVPVFAGIAGRDLRSDVSKFVAGCQLLKREVRQGIQLMRLSASRCVC